MSKIQYYMKLLDQILSELGADTLKCVTLIPGFGGYFKSIKSVLEYSETCVVLAQKRKKITIEGEKLVLSKYFEDDVLLTGEIKGVKFE